MHHATADVHAYLPVMYMSGMVPGHGGNEGHAGHEGPCCPFVLQVALAGATRHHVAAQAHADSPFQVTPQLATKMGNSRGAPLT